MITKVGNGFIVGDRIGDASNLMVFSTFDNVITFLQNEGEEMLQNMPPAVAGALQSTALRTRSE